MIEGTKQTDSMKESRKVYYLVTVNHEPKGICTSYERAKSCVEYFGREKKGVCFSDLLWKYQDDIGEHYISAEVMKRLWIQH